MGKLDGKVVIVTGAASGIGLATSKRLLADGATVVGADLAAGPGELGADWTYVPTDVTDEAAVAALVTAAVAAGGRLDGVVNAAGVAGGGLAHQVTAEEWHRVIAVNLTGTFFVAKHVIGQLLGQEPVNGERGAIVTLASIEGLEGTAGGSAYNASKGGVRLYTKSVALYAAKEGLGIRVNSVHPGYIWTPMVENIVVGKRDPEAMRKSIEALHPLGRIGEPDDIAYGILYLASDESKFVTGAELVIDGGYTAQ